MFSYRVSFEDKKPLAVRASLHIQVPRAKVSCPR